MTLKKFEWIWKWRFVRSRIFCPGEKWIMWIKSKVVPSAGYWFYWFLRQFTWTMDQKWQNLKAPLNRLVRKTLKQLHFKYMTPVQVLNFFLSVEKNCAFTVSMKIFNYRSQIECTPKCISVDDRDNIHIRAPLHQASASMQSQRCNTVLIEINGKKYFRVTPFFSIRAILQTSLLCWLAVDVDAGCKWSLLSEQN